jgi:cytidylate kinase
MIVTIDGPAGAGKSSVAKKLADALGFEFLDTGAMYRCVTLACLRRGIELSDANVVGEVARNCRIVLRGADVFLDDANVTEEIREPFVTRAIKDVADNPIVRDCLVNAQKSWAEGKNAVTEGRDQGTVAFPHAVCKIFLTATAEERARRRVAQMEQKNLHADFEEILSAQRERDHHDETRSVGALVVAPDAIVVKTDGMTEPEVLRELIRIVESKMPRRHQEPPATRIRQVSEALD